MARFDVHANPAGAGFVVDVQANLLSGLNTRVVVPLLLRGDAPSPAQRLNPCFAVLGHDCTFLPRFMAAVPRSELKDQVATLAPAASTILDAIDFLHQGW